MPTDLAELLVRADQADPQAADELFAALYGELRRLAERQLERGGGSLTLGTTTLVHDAYLSMVGRRDARFPDRARFFAYASRAMRGLVAGPNNRRLQPRPLALGDPVPLSRHLQVDEPLLQGVLRPTNAAGGEDSPDGHAEGEKGDR